MNRMSDEWQTPRDLFNFLNSKYHFDYDVCQDGQNGLAPYLGDWFIADYHDCVCYMNPPYSNPIIYVNRAIELMNKNVKTICLLKCDTSTKLFHKLLQNYLIYFIRGRLKFTHPNKEKSFNAPFASMLVIIER